MGDFSGARIEIKGIVQGVGFRPFVYGLASRLELNGWVRNTSAGVDIQVEGTQPTLDAFIKALQDEVPPLARIDQFKVFSCPPEGFSGFEIIHSQPIPEAFQPISPDVSICEDCWRELFDPNNRRYLYPFINCTNCGPRFTIIEDIPYDRPKTTMAGFEMCQDCSAEYRNPLDRRFHAQPVACPVCGPHIWLECDGQSSSQEEFPSSTQTQTVIEETQRLLSDGKIIAIKGLGGFHLACDALNSTAVTTLRERKLRVDKPFALMMPDMETIEKHCYLNLEERRLLESRFRPIVILEKRLDSPISKQVAPEQNTLGIMLPYTPLHYLVFSSQINRNNAEAPTVLVMTSGNLSEEPIATDNQEARESLGNLADVFLMHNRPIRTRCDDSVMRIYQAPAPIQESPSPKVKNDSLYPIRRSRGYAPDPVLLPWMAKNILATGAELKNTFCITRQDYAFISHHIGDMENYETYQAFEDGISHFERIFHFKPEVIAFDFHPNYLATRYALRRAEQEGIPSVGVQHHHAHIAACMAENGIPRDGKVIGVAFDGTGYGEDECIWGGEFLVSSYDSYERPFHLIYTPLPGGDKAIREPWRTALSWLWRANIPWTNDLPPVRYVLEELPESERRLELIRNQLENGLNAPKTSSIGRLYDAVASLIGLRHVVNYEAQGAIELEALADPNEKSAYSFILSADDHIPVVRSRISQEVDASPVIQEIIDDLNEKVALATISARFHNGLAVLVKEICALIRNRFELSTVVLSGGVWQNMTLLNSVVRLLQNDEFFVYVHRKVPTNDGGICLGQAMVADSKIKAL